MGAEGGDGEPPPEEPTGDAAGKGQCAPSQRQP